MYRCPVYFTSLRCPGANDGMATGVQVDDRMLRPIERWLGAPKADRTIRAVDLCLCVVSRPSASWASCWHIASDKAKEARQTRHARHLIECAIGSNSRQATHVAPPSSGATIALRITCANWTSCTRWAWNATLALDHAHARCVRAWCTCHYQWFVEGTIMTTWTICANINRGGIRGANILACWTADARSLANPILELADSASDAFIAALCTSRVQERSFWAGQAAIEVHLVADGRNPRAIETRSAGAASTLWSSGWPGHPLRPWRTALGNVRCQRLSQAICDAWAGLWQLSIHFGKQPC